MAGVGWNTARSCARYWEADAAFTGLAIDDGLDHNAISSTRSATPAANCEPAAALDRFDSTWRGKICNSRDV
jgi:hypothetical protein